MKRWMAIWLTLGLLACGVVGHAQALEIQTLELFESYTVLEMLPLEDGQKLLCGWRTLVGVPMEETEHIGYETLPDQTEGFALLVDASGKELWRVGYTLPTAMNMVDGAWEMPDGTFLLRQQCWDDAGVARTTQYHIVDREGAELKTLPLDTFAQEGVESMVRWTEGGYLGGGVRYDQGLVTGMEAGDAIVLFDEDLQVKWRLEDERLTGAFLMKDPRWMEDGFILGGERNTVLGDLIGQHPFMVKISPEGELLWVFEGNAFAMWDVRDPEPLPDGGVLFVSECHPMEPTPDERTASGYLTKLDAKGQHMFSVEYGEIGIMNLTEIEPLGDGFVLSGSRISQDGARLESVLLYVDAEGTLLGTLEPQLDRERFAVNITTGADGVLYLYGRAEEQEAGVQQFGIAPLDEAMFER